jgi:hypothetical protein
MLFLTLSLVLNFICFSVNSTPEKTLFTNKEELFLESFTEILKTLKKTTPTSKEKALITRGAGGDAIKTFGVFVQNIIPLVPPAQAIPLTIFSTAVGLLGDFVTKDEEYQEYLEFKRMRAARSFGPMGQNNSDKIILELTKRTLRTLRSKKNILNINSHDLMFQITRCSLFIKHLESKQITRTLTLEIPMPEKEFKQSDTLPFLLYIFFKQSYDLLLKLAEKISNTQIDPLTQDSSGILE